LKHGIFNFQLPQELTRRERGKKNKINKNVELEIELRIGKQNHSIWTRNLGCIIYRYGNYLLLFLFITHYFLSLFLELEAYSCIVSVLRARGPLTEEKLNFMKQCAKEFHISQERHKVEIRKASNDELLSTIADT
jgi:ENT domain.